MVAFHALLPCLRDPTTHTFEAIAGMNRNFRQQRQTITTANVLGLGMMWVIGQ